MGKTVLEGWQLMLQWGDFKAAVPQNRPPGDSAFTAAKYNIAWQGTSQFLPAAGPQQPAQHFRLANVQISVTLERNKMWSITSQRTDSLLRHEQGHYDIVALGMRDLFNDLVVLKKKEFDSQDDLESAISAAKDPIVALIDTLESNDGDGQYDISTNHGSNVDNQEKWNNAFSKARTTNVRLVEALKGWGVLR